MTAIGHFSSAQAAELDLASIPSDPSPPTDRVPELYQGSFLYSTPQEMLAALGVTVYSEDRVVTLFPVESGLSIPIEVFRAKPILIDNGGTQQLVRTWSTTIGNVLDEQRIEVGTDDIVEPNQQTLISPDSSILNLKITYVANTEQITNEPIAFDTINQNDATLLKGTSKVAQPGVLGNRQKKYQIVRHNGVQFSKTLESDTVTKQPVSKIVKVGTRVDIVIKSEIIALAKTMTIAAFGEDQWPYMYQLGMRESGFNPHSVNRYSGACGIPQAYPCNKLPQGINTPAADQIQWMIDYIRGHYGTPQKAATGGSY